MSGATPFDTTALQRITALFSSHADLAKAVVMRKYMRDLFPFLGIPSPGRRKLQREALAGLPKPTEGELGGLAGHLWDLPEREYQYVALDILAKHIGVCGPGFLATARTLITAKSWWDTVDDLGSHVVGDLAGC